ncbi:MAG TPA: hypothetical protein VKW04_15720 [Planctomycetota bacterium]|nr:hypothetical protein [Planctomycetota bacterium]
MEPAPSDRPRPWVLRVRQRRWWKRSSFWFLFILLVIFMGAAFWAFNRLIHLQADDDDSDGRVPRACLFERPG